LTKGGKISLQVFGEPLQFSVLSFQPDADSNEQMLRVTNETKVTIETSIEPVESDTEGNEETKESDSLPTFDRAPKSPFAGFAS
jgi:hypothetical protein